MGNCSSRTAIAWSGSIPMALTRLLILSDPAAWISDPVSCDNDRWIALNWMVHGEGSGNGIWRANPDGSDAVPLTSRDFGSLWGCSPDGKWLYYTRKSRTGLANRFRRRQTRTRAGSEPSEFAHGSGHTFSRRQDASDIYRTPES